jgi:hypothetical protein
MYRDLNTSRPSRSQSFYWLSYKNNNQRSRAEAAISENMLFVVVTYFTR